MPIEWLETPHEAAAQVYNTVVAGRQRRDLPAYIEAAVMPPTNIRPWTDEFTMADEPWGRIARAKVYPGDGARTVAELAADIERQRAVLECRE